MINTGPQTKPSKQSDFALGSDMRSYVLDQYKEVLFPKQISKFEKAHNAAMDR